MANLGLMLAGSAIGQGLGNAVYQNKQGEMDRMRMDQTMAENAQKSKVYDFQNNQMGRTLQEQQIGDAPTDGATDADRLEQLAQIAGTPGPDGRPARGDLQRKYIAQARDMRQQQQILSIANASRAITMGQFEPAAKMLNQTGVFGQIHSIGMADDVEQDSRNPTYSVYTAGQPDANGVPTQGPHVHVNQQMLLQLQSKPGDALHWLAYSQNMGQHNDDREHRTDQIDTKMQETERHNRALEVWKRANGGNASGKLPNMQWLQKLASTPKEQGGLGMSPQDALNWAVDPQKQTREYWQGMRLGVEVAKPSNMITIEDAVKFANALKPSTPGSPNPVTPPPGGGNETTAKALPGHVAQGPDNPLQAQGLKPAPGRAAEGVYLNPKGIAFKVVAGKTVAWSNTKKTWVPIQ